MKRSPQSAISFAIARKQNFFGRDLRNSQRAVLKNQFAVMLAIDERREESGPIRIVEIDERAQLNIAAQSLAQKLLVISIGAARAFCLRPICGHGRTCGRLDLFEGLVAESQHQPVELLSDLRLIDEESEVVLLDFSRRR